MELVLPQQRRQLQRQPQTKMKLHHQLAPLENSRLPPLEKHMAQLRAGGVDDCLTMIPRSHCNMTYELGGTYTIAIPYHTGTPHVDRDHSGRNNIHPVAETLVELPGPIPSHGTPGHPDWDTATHSHVVLAPSSTSIVHVHHPKLSAVLGHACASNHLDKPMIDADTPLLDAAAQGSTNPMWADVDPNFVVTSNPVLVDC